MSALLNEKASLAALDEHLTPSIDPAANASALRLERLNFRHLHHFYEVARRGSLKAAAEALELSSATLSTQLRQLEESVGRQLLVRESRRGVRLTEAGRSVWRHADRIFAAGEALIDSLGSDARVVAEPLRIGLATSIPRTLRSLAIGAFADDQDERPLEIVTASSERLVEAIRSGDLDGAITDRPTDPTIEGVWNGAAIENSGIVFLGDRRLVAHLAGDLPAGLDGARLVLPTARVAMRGRLERWLREQSLAPQVVGAADDPLDQARLALEKDALLATPACGMGPLLGDGRLKAVGRTQAVRVSFHLVGGDRGLSRDEVALWSARLRRSAARLASVDDASKAPEPGALHGKEWIDEEDSRSDAA